MSKTKRNKGTIKNKGTINNKTKKKEPTKVICPIGLKEFEEKFSKTIRSKDLKKNNSQKKLEFVKELSTKFAPSHITPRTDFYNYINYLWLKNISLKKQQEYIVQVDDFRLVQDKVYTQLHEIILDYIKTHNDKLSKNLRNFYTSVIDMNSKSYTKKLGKESELLVEKFLQDETPWKLLAHINSDEMLSSNAPFVWSLQSDPNNSSIYRCSVDQHQFTFVDINVYFDDGTDIEYKKNYRSTYASYVKQLFNTILGHNHNYNVNDVFDVEVEMFTALGCTDISKRYDDSRKVYADEALSKYNFDWKEFSTGLGFKTPPEFFYTKNINYLKCGSDLLLKNWKTQKWKTYWVWIYIRRLLRITRDWQKIPFEFFGSFERGQQSINTSNAVSAALYMSVPFNTFLSNEYTKKYKSEENIQFTKTLCKDLKIVFKRILTRNNWMSPSTKKYALKKLDNFNYIIGQPEDLRIDPDLDYTDVLYDNMKKIMDWRHHRLLELEGKTTIDIPMMDWTKYPVKMSGTQSYIVNASYTPSKNSIYINLGYLQKPFIDLDERGIEYNLAHIGYTIGHEMSHAFDDWGSKFGYNGNEYDWWTESDKKKYKEIQNDVQKQYEEFAKRDGIDFDASIGIGEDIADISGMNICDEYLRDFQENNKDIVPIRSLAFEVFYTYFAFQQKQKISKKALSSQLKTNPHPLDKYRCNIPLSRSEIFRALYNIKKGDNMWWHTTNTIW